MVVWWVEKCVTLKCYSKQKSIKIKIYMQPFFVYLFVIPSLCFHMHAIQNKWVFHTFFLFYQKVWGLYLLKQLSKNFHWMTRKHIYQQKQMFKENQCRFLFRLSLCFSHAKGTKTKIKQHNSNQQSQWKRNDFIYLIATIFNSNTFILLFHIQFHACCVNVIPRNND